MGHTDQVTSLARGVPATHGSSSLLLSGSDDGTARLWDLRTCSSVKLFTTDARAPVRPSTYLQDLIFVSSTIDSRAVID